MSMKGFRLLVFLFAIQALAMVGLFSAPPSNLDFLTTPKISDLKFSPDGERVASFIKNANGASRIVLRDVAASKSEVVTVVDPGQNNARKNPSDFEWVDSQHVIVTSNWKEGNDAVSYFKVGKKETIPLHTTGKYAIVDPLRGSSEYMIAERSKSKGPSVCRVLKGDLMNKKALTVIYEVESKVFEANTDRNHELRLIKRNDGKDGPLAWFARDVGSEEWKKLKLKNNATFYGFDYNPDRIWVGGYLKGKIPGIYRYSISQDEIVEELTKHPMYSVSAYGKPLFHDGFGTAVGLHLDLMKYYTQWSHPRFRKLQEQVDGIFKESRNRITAWSDDLGKLIVERHFSDLPPQTFLVNFADPKVEFLFVNGYNAKKGEAAACQAIKIVAENGLTLRGVFTKSDKASAAVPLVVLLRENPWGTMDRAIWDAEEQFLAAEGYAVLRLNFRGSGHHLGDKKLSWRSKEDALAPIRDIDAAIKWIGENKKVDTSKMAIIGSGAGGWIATYASIALPDRFKAVVSNTGIYDLSEYRDKWNIRRMGDLPFANGKKLSDDDVRSLSPSANADKLTSALFIAYTERNPGDYVSHAKAFAKNAKKAGVKVEKPYVGAWPGTRITKDGDFRKYYEKVGPFLKKYLR